MFNVNEIMHAEITAVVNVLHIVVLVAIHSIMQVCV